MQTKIFEQQIQICYHHLAQKGYVDREGCTSLQELHSGLWAEIHRIAASPRFDQNNVPIKDQWNIVSVTTKYGQAGTQLVFEFVFELHYYHHTLQLISVGILLNGRRPYYVSVAKAGSLPNAAHLLATCPFFTIETSRSLPDRRWRA
ncbi:hypothetical protein [Chitinophaga sp. S165]|uniref:hypothetical protein n=1 Tax=Chitinophaga sp. S165 TaxID=2135462 RepID=UPI000D70D917|nr:hypothetical protein [Chitinophaga sp. S165]PWV47151.1 hypothetical protein C7475_109239 [Chitinophaga sp. S165]